MKKNSIFFAALLVAAIVLGSRANSVSSMTRFTPTPTWDDEPRPARTVTNTPGPSLTALPTATATRTQKPDVFKPTITRTSSPPGDDTPTNTPLPEPTEEKDRPHLNKTATAIATLPITGGGNPRLKLGLLLVAAALLVTTIFLARSLRNESL